ncbi:MAG: plasminogen-binding N-terminal domain-containing protein [Helicobacteraceae bacterium]|jgi:hypothetical protein|nr:plasminogen-binding N-terminal domain-containing protein [Helicobacteraceae bacterium]
MKIVFFVCAGALMLFASAAGYVEEVDGGRVFTHAAGAKEGMSAVIVRSYDGGRVISHRCVVIEAQPQSAELSCEPSELFDSDAVPSLTLPIRKGDQVILAPLDKTALIVAPNVDRFVSAQAANQDKRFIHPDLFAVELSTENNPAPGAKEFVDFCGAWMIGSVIFAMQDGDYIVDCATFSLLSFKAANHRSSTAEMPFFHRLNPITSGVFSGKKVVNTGEFDAYYKKMFMKETDVKR